MPLTEEQTFTVEEAPTLENPDRVCIQISDLTPGQTYSIQIRGRDGTEVGLWSLRLVFEGDSESTSTTLDPVTGLDIAVSGPDFIVTWTNPSSDASGTLPANFKDVELEFNTAGPPATGGRKVYSTGASYLLTHSQITNWFGETASTIFVTARSRSNTGSLSSSLTDSATNGAPGAFNLTTTGFSGGVQLNWTSASGGDIKEYRVFRDAGQVATVGNGTLSHIDVPGDETSHDYFIRAVDVYIQTADSNTASGAATAGGGVTDHGALTGLTDDDHTQYLLVNGTRAMTGNLNMADNVVIIQSATKTWRVEVNEAGELVTTDIT